MDSVKDQQPTGEPSFVRVAICVGSDFDGQPVTLVDRLCLNRPAAEQMRDDMSMCVQQIQQYERQTEILQTQKDSLVEWNQQCKWISIGAIVAIVLVCAWFIRKANN